MYYFKVVLNLEMDFEELNIVPVSLPPELPGTMKPQDSPVAGS